MIPARQRQNFPKAVRQNALDRAAGRCEGEMPDGARCTNELQPGFYIFDHVITDYHGGRPTLDNCQVLCKDCNRAKTATDQAAIAHTRRAYDAHLSLRAPRRPMSGSRTDRVSKGFDGLLRDRDTGAVLSRRAVINVEDL